MLWLLTPRHHDLVQALQLSSGFLQAQRSAPYPLTATNIATVRPSANTSVLAAFQNGTAFNGSMPSPAVAKDDPWILQALDSYPWLANATGNPMDLVHGGFYMGADYVKHSFPLATSMSMLAWSLLQFRQIYEQVGVQACRLALGRCCRAKFDGQFTIDATPDLQRNKSVKVPDDPALRRCFSFNTCTACLCNRWRQACHLSCWSAWTWLA